MKLPKEIFDRAFKGFSVYDAAVVDRLRLAFFVLEDSKSKNPKQGFLQYSMINQGSILGKKVSGYVTPSIAVSRNAGVETILAGTLGGIIAVGDNINEVQADIPVSPSGPLVVDGADGLVTIADRVYAFGGWRAACYRESKDHWVSIRADLPNPEIAPSACGFNALHGFQADDIYGVGGRGDAWRYDGKRWHRLALPTNMLLESVCCAGDGYVYIGMQSGCLMRGREDSWEIIHVDTMTLPFKDMVWYQDKLWCTSDYGLWTVENGKLQQADVPPEVKPCAGNLSTADGVLLVAGHYGSALHDGTRWERLF